MSTAICGAGLVGCLCAAMLTQRGYKVTLFDARADPREAANTSHKSINLALSHRGVMALECISPSLAHDARALGIYMRGRMIHANGDMRPQDYGDYESGEVLLSVSRNALCGLLLDYVDKLSIPVYFADPIDDIRLDNDNNKVLLRTRTHPDSWLPFDWAVGADGAYSRIRAAVQRHSRLDVHQYYAEHKYIELHIPPNPHGEYALPPHYLHIWPHGSLMLIALPNTDKSFTLTLFIQHRDLVKIHTSNEFLALFSHNFPDVLALITEAHVRHVWDSFPKEDLVVVKCHPFHDSDKLVLLGDAAHAMVPFYGQGLNCAFEDVKLLASALDYFLLGRSDIPLPTNQLYSSWNQVSTLSQAPLARALEAYTLVRSPSINAIQLLAHNNYTEMASSVVNPLYLARRWLDSRLASALSRVELWLSISRSPGQAGAWESLYRMVTFRYGIAYEEALHRLDRQSLFIHLWLPLFSATALGSLFAFRYSRH